MNNNITCILNIYDTEIFEIIPIIGSILNTSEYSINIIKCNIICTTCNQLQSNKFVNWDIITNIFKRYKTIKFKNDIQEMPEYADMYITTNYINSHIIRRQYNNYILLYYNKTQLSNINNEGDTIINNIFRFNSVILADSINTFKTLLIDNKHNKLFLKNNCFNANRKFINYAQSLQFDYKKFHTIFNKHLHTILHDETAALLEEFIMGSVCDQIIDTACNNIKLATNVIKHYHCNNMDKDILKTLKFNSSQTKYTLSNNNISNIKFTEMVNELSKNYKTLIIMHNVFQYMPFEEIINTIVNMCNTKFMYISIISTQVMINVNNEWMLYEGISKKDISHGGYRPINLNIYPFKMMNPFKIYHYSHFINPENNYREDEYIHIYTYAEFIKLKTINEKFTKNIFIKYNNNKYNAYNDNKYVIYEPKDIDNMYDNVYNNTQIYYDI